MDEIIPDVQGRVLRLLLLILGAVLGAVGWWRWAGF
jgi:hypothetical protein